MNKQTYTLRNDCQQTDKREREKRNGEIKFNAHKHTPNIQFNE